MTGYLLVAAGAAVGAPLRYLIDRLIQSWHRTDFPWGTMTVNLLGSLVLGGLTGAASATAVHGDLHLLIGTGLCGALTTWSTAAQETVRLSERGRWLLAGGYVALSIAAGLAAAFAGHGLVRLIGG